MKDGRFALTQRALAIVLGALGVTGCVEDFPTVSAVGTGTDSGGRFDQGGDAMRDAQRPDAELPGDAAIAPDAAARPDAMVSVDADLPDMRQRPDQGVPDQGVPDMACVAVDEQCNGLDDDCDGAIDEQIDGAGLPCELGVGACAQTGEMRCNPLTGVLTCSAMPGMELVEICNGIDDDCDGTPDEDLGLGEACTAGVGQCQAQGVNECGDGGDVVCNAVVGAPADELCNGLDDDCDGTPDERYELGAPCSLGIGACLRIGAIACMNDIGVCDAEPGQPVDEACNNLDDDCDGASDEGLGKGDACTVGLGACFAEGVRVCDPEGAVVCDAPIIPPEPERCNGVDDDCDGLIDQGLGLGERCVEGLGECESIGEIVCSPQEDIACNAVPLPRADELCDGLDNDCDGDVDEGDTCAADAIAGCQVWLGWQDNFDHNAERTLEPRASWGDCPGEREDLSGDSRCNSTRGDANYQSFSLSGGADNNDVIGVRFACGADEISSWVQDHCEIFLAYGDLTTPAQIESLDPLDCAGTYSPSPFEREFGCVRTGHDTLFHPLAFVGGVNFDDAWGVALRCEDPALPARAAGLQASLAVHFALQDRGTGFVGCNRRRIANTPRWQESDPAACPDIGVDLEGRETCASSSGDGQFHGVKVNQGQLGRCWAMGVALKRIPLLGDAIDP